MKRHKEISEKLLEMHAMSLNRLQQRFQSSCQSLQLGFSKSFLHEGDLPSDLCREKAGHEAVHEEKVHEMEDLIHAMEAEFNEAEGDDRQDFEASREEIKNKNSEEYNVLKIQLEGNVEELERSFEEAHKHYINSTEHRSRTFEQLSKNDAASARVIEMRMKKLHKLQVSQIFNCPWNALRMD